MISQANGNNGIKKSRLIWKKWADKNGNHEG